MASAAAAAIRNIIQIESVGEAKGIKLFIKLNHKRSQNGWDPLYRNVLHHKNKSLSPIAVTHVLCGSVRFFFIILQPRYGPAIYTHRNSALELCINGQSMAVDGRRL